MHLHCVCSFSMVAARRLSYRAFPGEMVRVSMSSLLLPGVWKAGPLACMRLITPKTLADVIAHTFDHAEASTYCVKHRVLHICLVRAFAWTRKRRNLFTWWPLSFKRNRASVLADTCLCGSQWFEIVLVTQWLLWILNASSAGIRQKRKKHRKPINKFSPKVSRIGTMSKTFLLIPLVSKGSLRSVHRPVCMADQAHKRHETHPELVWMPIGLRIG